MDAEQSIERYVRQAADLLGLSLAAEYLPGVIDYFRLIADHAAALETFALDADIESAGIYEPCSPQTRE